MSKKTVHPKKKRKQGKEEKEAEDEIDLHTEKPTLLVPYMIPRPSRHQYTKDIKPHVKRYKDLDQKRSANNIQTKANKWKKGPKEPRPGGENEKEESEQKTDGQEETKESEQKTEVQEEPKKSKPVITLGYLPKFHNPSVGPLGKSTFQPFLGKQEAPPPVVMGMIPTNLMGPLLMAIKNQPYLDQVPMAAIIANDRENISRKSTGETTFEKGGAYYMFGDPRDNPAVPNELVNILEHLEYQLGNSLQILLGEDKRRVFKFGLVRTLNPVHQEPHVDLSDSVMMEEEVKKKKSVVTIGKLLAVLFFLPVSKVDSLVYLFQ
jgi:hypothetical protein